MTGERTRERDIMIKTGMQNEREHENENENEDTNDNDTYNAKATDNDSDSDSSNETRHQASFKINVVSTPARGVMQ